MLISAEPGNLSLPMALAIFGLWLCPAEGAIELADYSVTSGPAGYSLLAFEDEAVEAANAPVQREPSAAVPFPGPELMNLYFPEGHQQGYSLPDRDSDFRAWLRSRGGLTVEDNCEQDHRRRRHHKPECGPVGVPEASTWFAAGFALLGLALSAVESKGKTASKIIG